MPVKILMMRHCIVYKSRTRFFKNIIGGCSTPISALGEIKNEELIFKGNIFSVDGKEKVDIEKEINDKRCSECWEYKRQQKLLNNGGAKNIEGYSCSKVIFKYYVQGLCQHH